MGVPAEGVRERVAQAEIEAAAKDVDDDGVLLRDVRREGAQDVGAGGLQAARVVDAGDGGVIGDRARAGRGGDVGFDGGGGGIDGAVEARGAVLEGEFQRGVG